MRIGKLPVKKGQIVVSVRNLVSVKNRKGLSKKQFAAEKFVNDFEILKQSTMQNHKRQ